MLLLQLKTVQLLPQQTTGRTQFHTYPQAGKGFSWIFFFYYVFYSCYLYNNFKILHINHLLVAPDNFNIFFLSLLFHFSLIFFFFFPKTLISFIAIPSPYQPKYCLYSNLLLTLAAAHAGPSRNREVAQY